MFRSLLVSVDLSPASDRVIARVSNLPLAQGARLTLLHVVAKSLPPPAQRSAEADARKALAVEATGLARNLPKGVKLETIVKVGTPSAEIAKCATTTRAELVVMGRGGARALRDIFLGSTAERVIRRGKVPILAVRLPARGPYRRPAVALELDQASERVLDLLYQVVPSPRPSVEVIHACDAHYQMASYPSVSEDETDEYREHYRGKALREIGKRLGASIARAKIATVDAPSWKTSVRYGSARSVIREAVKKSEIDLLVLGTRGHRGVAHAFLGTVAGDVLREVACDVLVVPPRGVPAEAS